jgi:putative nucleotidyltransferase with HDIG domain
MESNTYMRLISTKVLREGMVIGRTIWNDAGHPLLQKNAIITPGIIQRLMQLNIKYVYIEDSISYGIEIEETVSPVVRNKVVQHIKESFRDVGKAKGKHASYILEKHTKVISSIVEELLDTISSSKDLVTILSDAYIYDEYLYQHSFQVTLYSLAIAKELGFSYEDQRLLGMGALLHDIGKIVVPTEILKKPDRLTEEEYEEIKLHTRYGFDILRNLHSVSLLVAHCAFQHHERLDGSGYPRGIKGDEIHPYAKVIGVADVFDAITSRRVYREKALPSEAIKIIEASSGIGFDEAVVAAFKRVLIMYPNGIVVQLSDGRRGVVIRQNNDNPSKPQIRVFEEEGTILSATYELSLQDDESVFILKEDPDFVVASTSFHTT